MFLIFFLIRLICYIVLLHWCIWISSRCYSYPIRITWIKRKSQRANIMFLFGVQKIQTTTGNGQNILNFFYHLFTKFCITKTTEGSLTAKTCNTVTKPTILNMLSLYTLTRELISKITERTTTLALSHELKNCMYFYNKLQIKTHLFSYYFICHDLNHSYSHFFYYLKWNIFLNLMIFH